MCCLLAELSSTLCFAAAAQASDAEVLAKYDGELKEVFDFYAGASKKDGSSNSSNNSLRLTR